MKRKLFVLVVIVAFASLAAYGTLAYFTDSETAHNIITSGEIDIALLGWADSDKSTPVSLDDGTYDVMPGTTITKIAEVKNVGSNAAYVRVKVAKDLKLAEGKTGEANLDVIEIDWNTTDWLLQEDGYYYYRTAVEPGETTEPLFTTVPFAETMENLYQNSTAAIHVDAFGVQVANNGDSPLTAAGWPEN